MTETKAKVVLMDIEGTTTSISFVKVKISVGKVAIEINQDSLALQDVLFPYAKTHSGTYLQSSWDEPTTQALVQDLCNLTEYGQFTGTTEKKPTVEHIANFINYLIDKDLKVAPLKTLQGYVWAKGYADGTIKGQ